MRKPKAKAKHWLVSSGALFSDTGTPPADDLTQLVPTNCSHLYFLKPKTEHNHATVLAGGRPRKHTRTTRGQKCTSRPPTHGGRSPPCFISNKNPTRNQKPTNGADVRTTTLATDTGTCLVCRFENPGPCVPSQAHGGNHAAPLHNPA